MGGLVGSGLGFLYRTPLSWLRFNSNLAGKNWRENRSGAMWIRRNTERCNNNYRGFRLSLCRTGKRFVCIYMWQCPRRHKTNKGGKYNHPRPLNYQNIIKINITFQLLHLRVQTPGLYTCDVIFVVTILKCTIITVVWVVILGTLGSQRFSRILTEALDKFLFMRLHCDTWDNSMVDSHIGARFVS